MLYLMVFYKKQIESAAFPLLKLDLPLSRKINSQDNASGGTGSAVAKTIPRALSYRRQRDKPPLKNHSAVFPL